MYADVEMSECGYSKAGNSYIAAAITGNQMIKHVVISIDMRSHSNQRSESSGYF